MMFLITRFLLTTKNHVSNEGAVDFHGVSTNFREALYYKKNYIGHISAEYLNNN